MKTEATIKTIALSLLHASPTNPRTYFDEGKLQELATSFASKGVLQPIVARPHPKKTGHYEVVAGERRFRAAKLAKLGELPAMVRELSDQDVLEIQIVENAQRVDVHPMDEGAGYRSLMTMDPKKWTADVIAEKVGKSKSHIYQRLKLAELVPALQKLFREDVITPGHAILVARLSAPQQEQVLKFGWFGDRHDGVVSVRQLHDYIHRNLMVDLHSAAFKKDDATFFTTVDVGNPAAVKTVRGHVGKGEKVQDGWTLPPCTLSPQRVGSTPDLFPDVKKGDVCTNPVCFHEKVRLHLLRRQAELSEELGTEVGFGSVGYLDSNELAKFSETPVRIGVHSYDSGPKLVADGKRLFLQQQKDPKKAKRKLWPMVLVNAPSKHDKVDAKIGDVVFVESPTSAGKASSGGGSKGAAGGAERQKGLLQNATRRLGWRERQGLARELVKRVKHPLPAKALGLIAEILGKHEIGWQGDATTMKATKKGHAVGYTQVPSEISAFNELGIKSYKDLDGAKPDLVAKALVRFAIGKSVSQEFGGVDREHVNVFAELFSVDVKAVKAAALEAATPHDKKVFATSRETKPKAAKKKGAARAKAAKKR